MNLLQSVRKKCNWFQLWYSSTCTRLCARSTMVNWKNYRK